MSEFDLARKEYNTARHHAEGAKSTLIQAREQVRRLERRSELLTRKENAESGDAAAAELREIREQLRVATSTAAAAEAGYGDASAARIASLDLFAQFTDPTAAVEKMPDDTPMALFPLRLETRFKNVLVDAVPQQFLWVRVFPDDALVDGFQPEIAETELDNIIAYWVQVWRAGGDVAGHRAAWTSLVKSYGVGRAKWLLDQYAPTNEEPVAAVGEHILVIQPAVPVPLAEQSVIASFWQQVWATAGAEHAIAFADLETALGASRAAEVEAELVPVNMLDVAVKPDGTLTPKVTFLDLPDPASLSLSAEAWTRGARTWLLPERLVLMGFRDGDQVLREVGNPIPSELQIGPDPAADEGDQFKADGADLEVPEGMAWTVDFDVAVAQGMGFSINLTALGVAAAFDRLFVLGVRVGSDAAEGAAEIEELFGHHQASRKGLSLLPQGRATNNTEQAKSGYTFWDNPDESFSHFFESDPSDDPGHWQTRKDGAWLAGMLGIDPAVMRTSPHYYATDQAEARAMNIALWPGTLGYYMEQMMEPVFDEAMVRDTRKFFSRFVIGRGTIPAIRIGRQPYGILPTTVWSKMNWWRHPSYSRTANKNGLPDMKYLDGLENLVSRAVSLWQVLANQVSHIGDPGPDPQQTLLDIVGLHPGSAEFYQRYSQTFTQHYNALGFSLEPVSEPYTARARNYIQTGLIALAELGWAIPVDSELPEMLEKIFLKTPNLLKGDLVDAELSDSKPLSVQRADGQNYIAWLQTAARTSHDVLRKQEGFSDGVPRTLLYLMLKHALDLGFQKTGLDLRRVALDLSDEAYKVAQKEPKFLYVNDGDEGRSPWEPLYRAEPAVTGDPVQRLGDYIPSILLSRKPYLNTQLTALDVLKEASTASLERALVEHVDCLSYRLDAWRMGMQGAQLSHMRQENSQGFDKGGVYVGAYGWLEDVVAKDQVLEDVELSAELSTIFDDPDAAPLQRDSSNFGHIHAPSLDHAVTAAILRNGHLANATPQAPNLLAVDLSSERVRLAKQVIEGISNGQSLGALLGYRLERALHDVPELFLDRLIYDLRRIFPLAGNRNRLTRVVIDRITKVEARNVLDGVAFMDHLAETGADSYPYDLSNLPPLSEFTGPGLPTAAEIGVIIDGHVEHMRSVGDSVADLSISEGVYQVVRGNYERAGGALDAFSKGTHPPVPEVVATPRSGMTLSHRVALHFEGALLPADPANTTPRAKGEPAMASWLAGQLPDPNAVFARVKWHDDVTATEVSLTPSMADLGLAAVDLFYLVDAGGARDMPGFDDLLIDLAVRTGAPAPRDDALFELEYKPAGVAGLTLFELAPLVRALRGFVLGARPLRPTDLSLQNEAGIAEDATIIVRNDKVQAVLADLDGTLASVETFIANLDGSIGEGTDPVVARDAARDNIDQWVNDYAAAVRPVLPFSLQAASLTSAIEGRRGRFTALHNAIGELIPRWEEKQNDYDAVMAEYGVLPVTASDEQRHALLIRAGRTVSTTVITPIPPLIADFENDVANLRGDLDTSLLNLSALHDGASRAGALLVSVTAFLPVIKTIDQKPFDISPHRDSILTLAEDLVEKAEYLRDDIKRRVLEATAELAKAGAALGDKAQTAATEAAQKLLGKSFILLPEFSLSSERLAEWDNVWATRAALLAHLKAGANATPFPVDDWLHGTARVRARLRSLEQATLLGEALGVANEPALEALQFPHRPDDAWLGLKFPDTLPSGEPFILEEDKLLYSAHFANGAGIDPSQAAKTYSGLLLDEWVEVIPTEQETTGLAFHFDRPNSEAPQAILLATPPSSRGTWQWQDLVDTLHETLDFARLRAVEPAQTDQTAVAPLIPAAVSAVTMLPIMATMNLAFVNNIQKVLMENDGE